MTYPSSESIKVLKPIYFQIFIVLVLFIGVYFPVLQSMVRDWGENSNYSHGYLVPFISGFIIYTKKKEIARLDISPSNCGLPLVILGLTQLVLGKIGSEVFLQRTSMLPVLLGIFLFLMGKPRTKKILFPILYLVFMIPIPAIIWNRIAFPLQLFASKITEHVIQMFGIPVLREGNLIHLEATSLEVVDACSGLRSLLSMLALSAAFAFLSNHNTYRKLVLFLSGAPIAIIINIIRLSFSAVLASRFGEKAAQGLLHEASGLAVFALGFALLLGIQAILSSEKLRIRN